MFDFAEIRTEGGLFVCRSWGSLEDNPNPEETHFTVDLDMGGPAGGWPEQPGEVLSFGKLRGRMAEGGRYDDEALECNGQVIFESLMLWAITILSQVVV